MSDQDTPQIDPQMANVEELKDILLHVISIIDILGEGLDKGLQYVAEHLPPPPPPDPRTPIQRLLESFDLEDERKMRASAVQWNDGELRPALKEAASGAKEAATNALAEMGEPDSLMGSLAAGALGAAARAAAAVEKATDPIAVGADDADVHVSDSAAVFKNWHIPSSKLDYDDFEQPLRVPITDPEIVENIKKARAMLPIIEQTHGPAERGKLCWTKYPPRDSEGWMFAEPDDSPYGIWLREKMHAVYAERHDKLEALLADPSASAKAVTDARIAKYSAATSIAIKEQEGAPSAINTYDKLVLTWGIGIAGPGKLPETFAKITDGRDIMTRRVAKAFYLCGFKYEGKVIGSQFHGGYQIVDLTKDPPCVEFRDNFHHIANKEKKVAKGDYDGVAFKTLQRMVDQIEMIYLLIQLARDPMTRETIFMPNYLMIERFGRIAYAEQIYSQALYVFAGEVRHNWGFGEDIVKWAIDKLDEEERRTAIPSIERDRAIAKGLVRYLMCALQRQRWKNALGKFDANLKAIAEAKKHNRPAPLAIGTLELWKMKAATEYGLTRMIDHYWKPLQTGAKTQDKSRVEVPDYLQPMPNLDSVPTQNYGWREEPPSYVKNGVVKCYDIGRLSQMDLMFPHDKILILGYDENKNVKIEDRGTPRTVTREGKPV